jgi:multiple sugar transport system permease protein
VGRLKEGGRYALLIAVAACFSFPLYWAVVLSMARKSQVFTLPPHLLPAFDLHPFERVLGAQPWALYFLNTTVITGATIALVLVTGALAGYALALREFRGREAVFALLLAALMVPAEATLIPDYVIAARLHLLNSLPGQILPFGANVFAIFLFRQFFKTLPPSLWEASQLDRVSWWRYLWRVALPMAKPAVVTVSLLTFASQWSAFQWPLIITQGPTARPVEVGLSLYQGFDGTHWREDAGAAILTTLPIIIVFAFAQRYFVEAVAGQTGEK